MKIAFACPSYGPLEPLVAHSQRAAIQTAWRNGIEVRSDIYVDRASWEGSRNQIVKAFQMLDHSFDGIFWCDADTVLPQGAIYELVGPEQDVVTGIYHGRHPPYEPKIFAFDEATDSYFHILKWPDKGSLFPVHGCGFGCVYTSRKALELTTRVEQQPTHVDPTTGDKITRDVTYWFKFAKFSEDLTWCANARAEGLTIWCNPNVVAGHLGETQIIGPEDFREWTDTHGGIEAIKAGITVNEKGNGKTETVVVKGLEPPPERPKHSIDLIEELRMTPSA